MGDSPPDIRVDGLARRFGRRWAVAGVSVTLPAGSSWMLTGPNGSGKSTLLRLLATAIKPHQGQVLWGDRVLWEQRELLRSRIAFLGHALHVWDDLSPRENLVAWARLGGLSVDPDALLRRVDLDPTRSDPVRALSAGMKRRLAIARLLLKQPQLALLDEPFGALDPEGRALVLDVIAELRARGTTLAIATHLPKSAAPGCTHHVHLEAGQIISCGTVGGE